MFKKTWFMSNIIIIIISWLIRRQSKQVVFRNFFKLINRILKGLNLASCIFYIEFEIRTERLCLSLHVKFWLSFIGNPPHLHFLVRQIILQFNIVLESCIVSLIFPFQDKNVKNVIPKKMLCLGVHLEILPLLLHCFSVHSANVALVLFITLQGISAFS
jgi:hypothetical protein